MKTLVIYDSRYGNTKSVAKAIGNAIPGEVDLRHVEETTASELGDYDLLVVGAPTHGGRASDGVRELLDQVPPPALAGVWVAGFDTRMTHPIIRLFGGAASKITRVLEQKGGMLAGPPAAFWVTGGEGPLREGELERAGDWAEGLVRNWS
jgi:flavodoxin